VIDGFMGYQEWINRERRIRAKLIVQFHAMGDKKKIRVCLNCREVVLCYETICPNCALNKIVLEDSASADLEKLIFNRIHCRDRYRQLFEGDQ
jgi:hypothetical protein